MESYKVRVLLNEGAFGGDEILVQIQAESSFQAERIVQAQYGDRGRVLQVMSDNGY